MYERKLLTVHFFWRCKISKEAYINEDIRAEKVRLISDTGEQLGIIDIEDALFEAGKRDLDLVNISPNADPPVCKIMDYGKHRYEQQKKEKEAKKKQKVSSLKEIRLSVVIEDHDMQVKAKSASKFLKDGDKLKVTMRFRGRERAMKERGVEVLMKFAEMLSDISIIESPAKNEGRNMSMMLVPKTDKK
ncbi:MAG: translation initiation factor IF-3 [Anaerovoracaceae bacterium]